MWLWLSSFTFCGCKLQHTFRYQIRRYDTNFAGFCFKRQRSAYRIRTQYRYCFVLCCRFGFGGLLLWLAYCQSCASDVHETGTSICNQQSIMVLLNLDASPIKDQVASVVLDLQGNVVTASPSTDHPAIDSTATKLLYQIFLEAGSLRLPSFRRMVLSSSSSSSSSSSTSSLLMKDNTGTDVAVGDIRYILTRDDAYIYIVAQKEP